MASDRDAAMRRVVEAARDAVSAWDKDNWWDVSDMRDAIRSLDALPAEPAPKAVGETVEMAVWRDDEGFCVWCIAGSLDDDKRGRHTMIRLGTVRLPLVKDRAR